MGRYLGVRRDGAGLGRGDGTGGHPPIAQRGPLDWSVFSSDARFLLTAGEAGYRLWDLKHGNPVSPRLNDPLFTSLLVPGNWISSRRVFGGKSWIWDVHGDERSVSEWLQAATAYSGRRLDASGVLAPIDADDLAQAWGAVEARRTEPAGVDAARSLSWHRREAVRSGVKEQWATALWHFRRLVATEPNPGRRRIDRLGAATALTKLDRREEALAILEDVAQETPDPMLYYACGIINSQLRRWDRAARDYERSASAIVSSTVWSEAAVLELMAGRDDAYHDLCEKYVARYAPPRETSADVNTLAWVCIYGPDALAPASRIVAFAEKAVEETPDDHATLNTLGAAYYRAGRTQDALATLNEGVRRHGQGGTIEDWAFLAMTHAKLGGISEAREYVAKAGRWLDQVRRGAIPSETAEDGHSWDQLLVCELLHREAEEKVMDAALPADPFAQ